MSNNTAKIHPSAEVSPLAEIGPGTRIWHLVQIREGAVIGKNCIIGKDAYIDYEVQIGDNVKIQNSALIYHGATIEDGVFIGPQVCLTNDRIPRAISSDGQLKKAEDWTVGPILVKRGASIGAGAIVLPNVIIGQFALVAAGAVVSRDVPDHGLVVGVPAKRVGYVCHCGRTMVKHDGVWKCGNCDWIYELEG